MKTLLFSVCACLLLIGKLNSQTLPNIQDSPQVLPPNVRIDGKLTEWQGQLKAYNKAIGARYTIAHNDKNLYLAISTDDVTTTAKILAGGITFSIQRAGVKDGLIPSVTFPQTNSTYRYNSDGWYSKTFKLLADSAAIHNAIPQLGEMKVRNFEGVPDSLLSIYNEYGVRANMGYQGQHLIWEISIPLERIGISAEAPLPINYNVRLNGVPVPPRPAGVGLPTAPPDPPVVIPRGARVVREPEIRMVTDFTGKYVFAKK